jgi:sulfate adenylyltransferase subunit 1 (EFTu-like GTPase family)
VQSVIEGGFAGRITSGTIHTGDEVIALPSNRVSRVRRIITFDGDLASADAPLSVTLQLEDDVAIERGGVLAAVTDLPELRDEICATMIWFDETPLDPGATYLLKHTTHNVEARVHTPEHIRMNDVVSVRITTSEPLIVKHYADNRTAGSFILIDPVTNATVAACMACPCPHESHSPPPS